MIKYVRPSTVEQLRQILEVQSRALKQYVSKEDQMSEGFITLPHTFEVIKKMNDGAPHCLAIDKNGTVLGYAMVMLRSFRNLIVVLVPMFETADRLLPNKNYLVMGQI